MTNLAKYCAEKLMGKNNGLSYDFCGKILTIPNAITSSGILLTIFLTCQIVAQFFIWAIPITVILIGLTDLLDGFAASKFNQHSWLGKYIDGLRDRLFAFTILLMFIYALPGFFTLIIVLALLIPEIYDGYIAYQIVSKTDNSSVHAARKLRQFLYVIGGFLLAIQQYWLSSMHIGHGILMVVMAMGSYSISFFANKQKSTKVFSS